LDHLVASVRESALIKLFLGGGESLPTLLPETLLEMADLFRPGVEALELHLGRDLGNWKSGRIRSEQQTPVEKFSATPIPGTEYSAPCTFLWACLPRAEKAKAASAGRLCSLLLLDGCLLASMHEFQIRMGIRTYRDRNSASGSSGRICPADWESLHSSRTSPSLPSDFRKSMM